MNQIQRKAGAARRRMVVQRFFHFLPWTLLAAGVLSAIGLALPKLVHLEADVTVWLVAWVAAPAALALIVTTSLTLVGRATLADAAAEIDRRFGLRERLSSALVSTQKDRDSELGIALLADAERRAEAIHVRDHFNWGVTAKLLIPAIPALLAAAIYFAPNKAPAETIAQKEDISLTQVKKSTDVLMQQIKTQRKKAEDKGLTAAVDMFKKLEGDLADLRKNTKLDTKQAFAKLNDIKEQLSERKKELADSGDLKKNLQNLKKLDPGPADELADAMKEGDFTKAEEALEKLMNKLENGEMTAEEMQQMQKQLSQLEQALSEAAKAQQEAKQALEEQIKQAEAAGDMQKASQLQRKLEKMQASDSSMAQMQEMADMLAQASESMEAGDMQAASEALEELMQQLGEMNEADGELQDLDELMDSLAQSKSDMMDQLGQMGELPGQMPGNGSGLGDGQGQGDRPEEEDDVDFYDSRQRDQMRVGETVYGGKVGGANKKGTTQVEVQEIVLSAMSEEPDPLDDTPLPKFQSEHTRSYFNAVREGK